MSPPPAEQLAARIFMGPALRAQPDRRLVDLVRDGYDAAFEEIVRRYRRPLDRFAAGIVGDGAEDVTQDSFSKALLALRGSEAEIELRPWLYRIVRNTALNDLRDRAPAAEELSERLPGARSAAAEVEAREDLRDLMDRLQALPEPQRAALVMRELEGLSHEEIAAALGVSGGAARQAIFRARAALREGLGFLVPLPVLRALAEHGGDAGGGGAIAAGATSAGGAALGGGALKVGMATVLIAGSVGAGVAIEHHRGHRVAPEAAEAAPLASGRNPGAGTSAASTQQSSGSDGDRSSGADAGDRHSSDGKDGSSSAGGIRSGPGGESDPPGDSHSGGSSHSSSSGDGSHSSRSGGASSGSDDSSSGAGDHHGGSSGSDDSSGSGSNSGSGSSDDDGGGPSGASGGDDSLSSGKGSGDGAGELVESESTSQPAPVEGSGDGGGSSSGGEGSGEDTSSGTSGTSGPDSSGSEAGP